MLKQCNVLIKADALPCVARTPILSLDLLLLLLIDMNAPLITLPPHLNYLEFNYISFVQALLIMKSLNR